MFYNSQYQNPNAADQNDGAREQQNQYQQTQVYSNNPRRLSQEQNQITQQRLIIKIGMLMNQLINLKEKLYFYEDLTKRLKKENQNLLVNMQTLQQKLHAKDNEIQAIMLKLKNFEVQKQQMLNTIQKLQQKSKDIKIQQNNFKNKGKNKYRELSKINQILQRELTLSNSKIIELQKLIQDNSCQVFFSHLSRLRQLNFKTSEDNEELLRHTQINLLNQNFAKSRTYSSTKKYRF